MYSIIVGFPKLEDANNIKNAISRNGYSVTEACTMASQIIARAYDLDEGIIVCGYRFSDMHYSELYDSLPKGFEMLLIASPEKLEYCPYDNIVCLPMPLKTHDLLSTIQLMYNRYQKRKKAEKDKPKVRTEEERALILSAKELLIERNNMTEVQAHRYLQKNSMDNKMNMVDMAKQVIARYQ